MRSAFVPENRIDAALVHAYRIEVRPQGESV